MDSKPSIPRQAAIAVAFLAAVALTAFLGSLASTQNVDGWYASAEKVPWDPPNSVFGPVWSALYFLIAIAGWLIWRAGYREGSVNAAKRPLAIWATQIILNGLWTPAFFAGYLIFGRPAWWIALAVILSLIAVVAWLAAAAAPWSRVASWIMVPYLLWLIFATSLNIGIIVLN